MGDYPQVSRAGTQSESTTITNREREREREICGKGWDHDKNSPPDDTKCCTGVTSITNIKKTT